MDWAYFEELTRKEAEHFLESYLASGAEALESLSAM